MIHQDILDTFAKSVADTMHQRSGKRIGYYAKPDARSNRVTFTFKAGEMSAHCTLQADDLSKANSWQGLADGMVAHALSHIDPKISFAPTIGPEIPVFIDQAGRRHHTLKAETGLLGLRIGN